MVVVIAMTIMNELRSINELKEIICCSTIKMADVELSKSGIAMQKLRSDPEKYLNERRRDVLRYVEKRGSWPISQNWRKYGFAVAEIVGRIRKGGREPDWEKLPT
tara:strand:+ start:341 stop:655 length:315 start_codon:yes stop_codon:yes gene_type:complete